LRKPSLNPCARQNHERLDRPSESFARTSCTGDGDVSRCVDCSDSNVWNGCSLRQGPRPPRSLLDIGVGRLSKPSRIRQLICADVLEFGCRQLPARWTAGAGDAVSSPSERAAKRANRTPALTVYLLGRSSIANPRTRCVSYTRRSRFANHLARRVDYLAIVPGRMLLQWVDSVAFLAKEPRPCMTRDASRCGFVDAYSTFAAVPGGSRVIRYPVHNSWA